MVVCFILSPADHLRQGFSIRFNYTYLSGEVWVEALQPYKEVVLYGKEGRRCPRGGRKLVVDVLALSFGEYISDKPLNDYRISPAW